MMIVRIVVVQTSEKPFVQMYRKLISESGDRPVSDSQTVNLRDG